MVRIHSISLGFSEAYLIEYAQGIVLVDAGMPGNDKAILARLASFNHKDLRLVYITHAHLDHYGGAQKIRQSTGAQIAVHRADREAMERGASPLGSSRGRGTLIHFCMPVVRRFFPLPRTQVDRSLEDGESLRDIGLDAWVLHTPGHTPGSSCLVVENKVVFIGDLLSSQARPHVQRFFAHDWSQVASSLARLKSTAFEVAYPGHGRRPISKEAVVALQVR